MNSLWREVQFLAAQIKRVVVFTSGRARGAESGELAPGRETVRAGLATRACMLTRRGLSRACFSLMIIGVENCSGHQREWGRTARLI